MAMLKGRIISQQINYTFPVEIPIHFCHLFRRICSKYPIFGPGQVFYIWLGERCGRDFLKRLYLGSHPALLNLNAFKATEEEKTLIWVVLEQEDTHCNLRLLIEIYKTNS